MSDLCAIVALLKEGKKFNLISHMLPDGDSVGSLLGLGLALKKVGKEISMYMPGHIPNKYSFLPGADDVIFDPALLDPRNTLVVIDSSDPDRLGEFKGAAMGADKIINLDHHVTNQHFGTLNHVDEHSSASGEIVFDLLLALGVPLDEEIATALYVAISTDTGSFKYENTTDRTHEITAELLRAGVKPALLSQRVFDERPLTYYRLLREALSSFEMYAGEQLAVMTISRDLRDRNGATSDDLDGLVNYSRNIEGVELGILFYIESSDEVKIGFRSRSVDVSVLAGRFNGGGHPRAAGCRMKGTYEDVKRRVISESLIMLRESVE